MHKYLLSTLLLLIVLGNTERAFSANRYWVSGVTSNWNNVSNWSTGSGGTGGASVPAVGDFVYFNANGLGNCNIDIALSFDGINTTGYTGVIDLNGFGFNPVAGGVATCLFGGGTFNDTPGSQTLNFTTTSIIRFRGTTFNLPIDVVGGRIGFDGGVFNSSVIVEDNGGASHNGHGGCTFNSTFQVTNSGTSYFLMGYINPDIFNGTATFLNTSTSYIRMAYNSVGTQFNENIILGNTGGGIRFSEQVGGSSVLANTKLVLIHTMGFDSNELRFSGFSQVGTTAQSFSLTGTASLYFTNNSIFNGAVDFDSPRVYLNGATFNSTSDIEKTGAGSNYSSGGNVFVGNCILKNSGSGTFILGNSTSDDFQSNLLLNNTGTNSLVIANNSIGNTIGGDLSILNNSAGASGHITVSSSAASTLTITGSTTVDNLSILGGNVYLASSGAIVFNNNLMLNNGPVGTNGSIYLANSVTSNSIVNGSLIANNTGSGVTKRMYIGNQGDVTVNGAFSITNSSTATNSQVYCNHSVTSTGIYNDNITLVSSNASCDGVYFGNGNGVASLADTKTVTIGGAGFVSGYLEFRNFTQLGTTSQTLLTTGTTIFRSINSTWSGNIDFRSPNIYSNGSVYNGTTHLEKTGGNSSDYSSGGNLFVGDGSIVNSGSQLFSMGNGLPDVCQANLTLLNSGNNSLRYATNSAGNTIAGNLSISNIGSGVTTNVQVSGSITSSIDIDGSVTSINNTNSTNARVYIGNRGSVVINGNLSVLNTGVGNNYTYLGRDNSFILDGTLLVSNYGNSTQIITIAETTNSSAIFNDFVTISNFGTGVSNYISLGTRGDVTLNGVLTLNNSSSATNSNISCNIYPESIGLYNENIFVENTNTSGDGVSFGRNGGFGTLAATKVITISAGGFVAGELHFRNFTQVGPTDHTLLGTGTARIYNRDSNWGGNVDFRAPRMYTRATTYNQTSHLEKTGGIANDNCEGGNLFVGDVVLKNSGSLYFLHGSSFPDVCQGNLDLINSGSHHLYFGYNSLGNTVAGNVVMDNTGASIRFSDRPGASVTVGGSCQATNTSALSGSAIFIGNSGDVVLGSTLDVINTSAISGEVIVANGTNSEVIINGNSTVVNSGGNTTSYVYLGNYGDITFNGLLSISNSSTATNSSVLCNYRTGSIGNYNGNVTVESTVANNDGVSFGRNGGFGTLAAVKAITISAGGFVAGELYFRNFTQVGPTDQTLLGTGTTRIYNRDSNWGGNVDFRAPRMYTRETTYNQTSHLEKTGGIANDNCEGGNLFVGDVVLKNSGSLYFLHGSNFPDVCQGNLDLINSGSHHLYFGYNSLGNTVAGNVVMDNTGASIRFSDRPGASVTVGGSCQATNTSALSGSAIFIGNSGDVILGNTLDILNGSTISGEVTVANGTDSEVIVNGNSTVTNLGSGTTSYIYLGEYGDVTFNGALSISNSSTATNSSVFCNDRANSIGNYNENIMVESTVVNNDGVNFGRNGGSGTLAATKVISVGAGGFVSGNLLFRNFTQIGPTDHTLLATGTSRIYNRDSNWGGNVDFRAPRMFTRETTYNQTSYLEKTGGVGDDNCPGGNLFVGDAVLKNSGSSYFLHGSSFPDVCQGSLDLINTGSNRLYFAYNSVGNTVAGDVSMSNTGIGSNTSIILSSGGASTMEIAGDCSAINNATSTTSSLYIGNSGDVDIVGNVTAVNLGMGNDNLYIASNSTVTISGDLTVTNSGSVNNNYTYVSSSTNASVTIGGNSIINNANSGNLNRFYFGSSGDITCNGTLAINNSSSSPNSQVYCNNSVASIGVYNDNISVENTSISGDGVYFGASNGTGTLASGKSISISPSGFVAGYLYFRNFTQLGGTPQTLHPTGTSRIENYNSEWNGNVDFRSPRHYLRGTIFNGTAFLEKNGANNDASTGGNTFNNDAIMQVTGTGYFMPANGTANDFNGDATYIQSGVGRSRPTYNAASTYAGNITVNSNGIPIIIGEASNARAILDGTTSQSINNLGTTVNVEFRDLQTLNPNGEITLNTPIVVRTELDLDQGNLISSTANLIYMNDNSTVSSVSDDAFVDGPLEKIGNETFTFPVGKVGVYRPAAISSPSSSSARFRGEFFAADVVTNGIPDLPIETSLDHVSNCEYWIIDRNASTNNVNVTLSYKNYSANNCSGVLQPNDLAVARWDGTIWRNHGNGGITGSATSGTVITSAPVTSFSPFTLADLSGVNPLPIELVDFTATNNQDAVDLYWQTASEINNDYFTIERSADGENFNEILTQQGAGNYSGLLSYYDVDRSPLSGVSFYRLKQTDFDGEYSYSGVIKVNRESTDVNFSAYPNPVNDIITIRTDLTEFTLLIYSADGRLINKIENQSKVDLSSYSNGIYNFVISSKGVLINTIKVVKI